MTDQQTASPELQMFFDKILSVKKFCKECVDDPNKEFNMYAVVAYEKIYNMLDEIIKDERTEVTHV